MLPRCRSPRSLRTKALLVVLPLVALAIGVLTTIAVTRATGQARASAYRTAQLAAAGAASRFDAATQRHRTLTQTRRAWPPATTATTMPA